MFFLRYITTLFLFNSGVNIAQVDFATKEVIDNVVVYQDSKIKGLFYYAPYGLQLVKDNKGKPDFKFIQMRYTGTKLSGDQGAYSFKSLLRFKVANHVPSQTKRDSIKKVIKNKGFVINKLQPLPIHNLQASLIHTAEGDTVSKKYSSGFFENTDVSAANSYWTERDFTLRLNNEDAQLFWNSFQGTQPTVSVNYSFSAKGINSLSDELFASGPGTFTKTMEEFATKKDSINTSLNEKIVVSGALSIIIDTRQWPDLTKQIDINERIPPEYAALDVYCFDFNNDIRKDIHAKRIEIKAEGVGGNEVVFKNTFKATEPDVYAKTIRFIYAVKLDKPYSYRITEIFNDGRTEKSEWKTVENWHQILDITSQPENK
jgi:hypothetical protein